MDPSFRYFGISFRGNQFQDAVNWDASSSNILKVYVGTGSPGCNRKPPPEYYMFSIGNPDLNLHLPLPDAQCITYLPTKLGSFGGKCTYIYHTLSIWDWHLGRGPHPKYTILNIIWSTDLDCHAHGSVSTSHFCCPKSCENSTITQPLLVFFFICAMVKSRYIGDGHPTFNRNPYNGAL